MEVGKLGFEIDMIVRVAADIARTARPCPHIVQSRFHGGDDLGMLAHREVVVGTPDGDRFGTAVTGKAACVGEGALVTQDVDEHPVAPLAVELCQRGIKDCVVPLLPTARWRFSNGKYCSSLERKSTRRVGQECVSTGRSRWSP